MHHVTTPNRLSAWQQIARKEIYLWIRNNNGERFTDFLYEFAHDCDCGWGVMVDFNERLQRVVLVDKYYQWMHKLRDEIYTELEKYELFYSTENKHQ